MIANMKPDDAQEEQEQLELCEVTLQNGLRRQLEGGAGVGAQLAKIRANELHRAAGCETFEAYCREVLEMGRDQVDRFLKIAEVVGTIRTAAAELELPVGEHQAVMLARITRSQLVDCWRTLLSFCASEQIALTDGVVRRAVEIARKQSSLPSQSMDGERAKKAPRGVQVTLAC